MYRAYEHDRGGQKVQISMTSFMNDPFTILKFILFLDHLHQEGWRFWVWWRILIHNNHKQQHTHCWRGWQCWQISCWSRNQDHQGSCKCWYKRRCFEGIYVTDGQIWAEPCSPYLLDKVQCFVIYNLRRPPAPSYTRSSSPPSFWSSLSNLKRGQQFLGALVAVVRSTRYIY